MVVAQSATLFFLGGVSLMAAAAAVAIWHTLSRRAGARMAVDRAPDRDLARSYAFRDGYLLTGDDGADPFLPDPIDRATAWGGLCRALTAMNPQVEPAMRDLRRQGSAFLLFGELGPDKFSISGRREAETCHLTVAPAQSGRDTLSLERQEIVALETELAELQRAMEHCPALMWREDENGQIDWANPAYFALLEKVAGARAWVWPIRRLFADTGADPGQDRAGRRSLTVAEVDQPLWFDIAGTETGDGRLFSALPIDPLVSAESSLRAFVQTLSKTFAHLTTGLAIFDRDRRLVLFNPALVTLSGLDPQWLSARPGLFDFLDQLREGQRMPEPKDYKAWRAGLAALELAAQDGTYQELWNLPTGQTYRVIGRPHPDGAVAFLFEDISSEVTLTRQFRADLDLYQAVLDDSCSAIAVFSSDGNLVLCNDAYVGLWGHDPRGRIGTVGTSAALEIWRQASKPSLFWDGLGAALAGGAGRGPVEGTIVLTSGQHCDARAAPLKGRATVVTFRPCTGADRTENRAAKQVTA